MDDDIETATHIDNDHDLWRITPSGAHLWSNHQHRWVEARTVLHVTQLAHGPAWLTPVHTRPAQRTEPA